MQTIVQILGLPDGCPIDAVQGKIIYVDPIRTTAKGHVQNATLSDVGGNKIKLTVWDHPDMTPLKDKEYVLHSSGGNPKFPAIKVVHGSYVAKKDGKTHKAGDTVKTIELSVNKNGIFQFVEVYHQNAGTKPAPAQTPQANTAVNSATADAKRPINGMKVGMALNNACESLTAAGKPLDAKEIYKIASSIVRISDHMEAGNLYEEKKKVEAAPAAQPDVHPEAAKNDEDVPY